MQANSEVTDRGGTSRVAFPPVEVDDEIPTPTRQFAVDEITSGLPDDSREEDERQEERRLRDLRGRVRAATAVVPGTPGLAEALTGDWRRAALFTARYGVSETLSQTGVRPDCEVIWTFQ